MERSLRIERKDWLRLVAVGIVGTTMYQTMFMLSVKYTSATNASLLIAMSPIFTGILAVLHKQERFSMKVQIGSIVAFIGAKIRFINRAYRRSYLRICVARKHNWISRAIAGWYPILAQPLITKYSAMRVTSWSTLIELYLSLYIVYST